jgi:Methyltransferase FkbM domain
MNPQNSIRYVLGLYEHELNSWLVKAIPRVDKLFDIGANHGYFCLGVMAAWHRLNVKGVVWAFEPQSEEVDRILKGRIQRHCANCDLIVEKCFVGEKPDKQTTAIDDYIRRNEIVQVGSRSMIKIDVEGAEMDVLRGARSLVVDGNLFLIEVHSAAILKEVQKFFLDNNHAIEVIEQSPLPIIGRENRDLENWWVVSKL